jgi:hypothetical protein
MLPAGNNEGKSYVLPPINVPRWRARFLESRDSKCAA